MIIPKIDTLNNKFNRKADKDELDDLANVVESLSENINERVPETPQGIDLSNLGLILPIGTPINAVAAGFVATVNSRPDDYVKETEGVNEVLSSIIINGISYIFASSTGDDPSIDYTDCVPVITASDASMSDIANAFSSALISEITTFSESSVVVEDEEITAYYKTKGDIGNDITYVNSLVVAGDITVVGIVNGKMTGGIDGTSGAEGQVMYDKSTLWICNATDLTTSNSNWKSINLT